MKGRIVIIVFIFIAFGLARCKNDSSSSKKESILEGSASILVDETLLPIVEDQVAVFESDYNAKIKLVAKSEAEAIQTLLRDSAKIIILPRKLTKEEMKVFDNKQIFPKVTMFATDAIAFISNSKSQDTLIALEDVINFMQGKNTNPAIKGLVFDNPNSSTVRYMNTLAKVSTTPEVGVYSFKTNDEVIDFVSKNQGMIGVVGLNWLAQPTAKMQPIIDKVKILKVKGVSGTDYYFPSQNNLAEGKYPLARDLYIVNAQGFSGLGIGFASFIAGDIGQRIVLKSGLLPIRIPGRKIQVRK